MKDKDTDIPQICFKGFNEFYVGGTKMNELFQHFNQLQQLNQLNRIVIKGYKSIRDCDIKLNNLNVLIGSNGAGKSNFISVFTLLHEILKQRLSLYTAKRGTNALFYNGTKTTDRILTEFHFGLSSYAFELEATDYNRLVFHEERSQWKDKVNWLSNGHHESAYLQWLEAGDAMSPALHGRQWRVYHFHDTSSTSRIKTEHDLSNREDLMDDARNLAAFLYRLCKHHTASYKKILKAIQRIAPYFNDFILRPEEGNKELIILRWQQNGCDDVFSASQLSDGTLRFICLATLLLMPEEMQPSTMIIDEPELGLHPYAITIFSELVKKVATKKQIILATQSVELLDHFEPEDVIVVDRTENGSAFKRLDAERLAAWL